MEVIFCFLKKKNTCLWHDEWHIDWAIMGQQTLGLNGEADALVVLDIGSNLGAVINTCTHAARDKVGCASPDVEDAADGSKNCRCGCGGEAQI